MHSDQDSAIKIKSPGSSLDLQLSQTVCYHCNLLHRATKTMTCSVLLVTRGCACSYSPDQNQCAVNNEFESHEPGHLK